MLSPTSEFEIPPRSELPYRIIKLGTASAIHDCSHHWLLLAGAGPGIFRSYATGGSNISRKEMELEVEFSNLPTPNMNQTHAWPYASPLTKTDLKLETLEK
jgi:hypothetical protein